MSVEDKLRDLGLSVPKASTPLANYVPVVRTGNLLFLAGHLPMVEGKLPRSGKVGKDLSIVQGYEAAQTATLNCLGSIKGEIGDLDKVTRIVKVVGFVNSAEGFVDQPKVINGASDLLSEAFGEAGKHARSAVGVSDLPANAPVEIEMIVEFSD